MSSELFYAHILNMNRGSLHTRSFRYIHLSVFKYGLTKMALRTQKVSGAFEKGAPGRQNHPYRQSIFMVPGSH